MSLPTRHTLENLRLQINEAFTQKDFVKKLYKSTNAITGIGKAIHQTDGIGWASYAKYDDGSLLFPTMDAQKRFTELFQPYISHILIFLGKTPNHTKHGGASSLPPTIGQIKAANAAMKSSKASINVKKEEAKNLLKEAKELRKTNSSAAQEKINQASQLSKEVKEARQQNVSNETHQDSTEVKEAPVGPDDLYSRAVKMIDSINTTAYDFASNYGILHYEHEFEKEGDIHIIPDIISQSIQKLGPTGMAVGTALSKIKLPIRTIVFITHLLLDVSRVTLSLAGSESNSRVLSIIVALVELLKGDWKQAILSFIGFYGMTPLLIGQNIKIFLYLFKSLAPHLQENIIYGIPSLPKSMVIGILLTIFKITAPHEIREPVKNALEQIRLKTEEINKTLVQQNLQPRSEYFSPTYDDFNNLQSLINGDNEYICSCEFDKLVKPLQESSILYIIIQLIGIPINEEFRRVKCGSLDCKPFVDLIVEKGMQSKNNTTVQPLSDKAKEILSELHTFMPNIEKYLPQSVQEYMAKMQTGNKEQTKEIDDNINRILSKIPEDLDTSVKNKIISAVVSIIYDMPNKDDIIKSFVDKQTTKDTIRKVISHIPSELPLAQKEQIIRKYVEFVYKDKELTENIEDIIQSYITFITERDGQELTIDNTEQDALKKLQEITDEVTGLSTESPASPASTTPASPVVEESLPPVIGQPIKGGKVGRHSRTIRSRK